MILRIQDAVNAAPEASRRSLSRQVCEWLGWRSSNGKLQEMSCRKALKKLERQGVLRLPARERICEVKEDRAEDLEVEIAEVCGGLEELGEVTVKPVESRHSRE